MKERRLYKLGMGAGLATMAFGVMLAIAPVAGADHTDPSGFNGTVKIDGLATNDGPGHSDKPNDPADDGTDNDPHVDCALQLEFFNFDHAELADITIAVQPPTGQPPAGRDAVVYSAQDVVVSDDEADGAGRDLDETIELAVHDDVDLRGFAPHPKHGWHVKLTVDIFRTVGEDREIVGQKHKVFWIEECAPETSAALNVRKLVSPTPAGTGPSFAFTGPSGETFSLAHDGTDTFVLDPGTYTVTETETGGYDLDDVTCYSDYGTEAQQEFTVTDVAGGATVTLAAGDDITCVFTNVPETATLTGGVVVSKVAGANAPSPSPTFSFRVDCDGFDLDPDTEATHSTFPLVFGASKSFAGMPVGTTCDVTETETGGATSTTHSVDGGGATQGATAVDVSIRAGENATVAFTNNYPAPSTPLTVFAVDIDKVNDANDDGTFADIETADDAGDEVVFQITIRNTGAGDLVLQSLYDAIPGRARIDLLGDAVGLDCSGALTALGVGSVLPAGSVTVCTFALDGYAPSAGGSLTNTVSIVTNEVSDADNSTVETDEAETAVLPNPPAETDEVETVVLPSPSVERPAAEMETVVLPSPSVERPAAETQLQLVPPIRPALTPPAQTPAAVAPNAVVPNAAAEVRGDVVTRRLARTGDDTRGVAGMGAFLVALGAALVLMSRRQLVRC